ncbi:hypothetical protein H0H93_014347 [Arthromyces matolae]|nr:hypothetical protein H0H93_014347 [Arthromyces matolae]
MRLSPNQEIPNAGFMEYGYLQFYRGKIIDDNPICVRTILSNLSPRPLSCLTRQRRQLRPRPKPGVHPHLLLLTRSGCLLLAYDVAPNALGALATSRSAEPARKRKKTVSGQQVVVGSEHGRKWKKRNAVKDSPLLQQTVWDIATNAASRLTQLDGPNVNRLSLKLSGAHPSIPPATSLVRHNSNPSPPSPAARELDDMFDEIGLPYPHLYHPLLDTFFSTLSRHFPSISRKRIEERLESGTMSPFFLNCAFGFYYILRAALKFFTCRFLPSARDDPSRACAPYIAKAQELIIVLIHLPTTDVVTGLLLLSWASYGQNSESGLWEYSGMAIRMAMDLGLHEVTNVYEPYLSKAHVTRARLLFWSLFVTDRILAFSKGRPPTIPEEIIEIPLPVDEDFVPDPARADADENELPQPIPFVHMVRLMVLCGRITTVLTGCRGETRTLMPHVMKEHPQKLKALREELAQFYADLKDLMRWSVDAFKLQEARGHGDSFLTLHLWANAILAVSFYPELQERPEGNFAPITQNVERSTKLALASSRVIAECLVFADLFASHSYLTSPFVVEPIYVASLAFINDMKSAAMHSTSDDQPTQTVDNLLSTLARQNLAVLSKAVHRMEHYWVGISTISDIVEHHAAGLGFQRIDSSRKSRLNVSMPDIVLPDSPPIFTNAYTQRQSAILPSQITNSTLPVAMMLDSGESNNSPSQTVNLQPFKGDYKSSGAFALLVGLDGMHFTDYNSSEASLSDGTTPSSQSFSTRIEA